MPQRDSSIIGSVNTDHIDFGYLRSLPEFIRFGLPHFRLFIIFSAFLFAGITTQAQNNIARANPSNPWVFWYWMHASVSREGITADLKAMKANGIAGAYLMPIQGVNNPPLMQPPVEQLSASFWGMVRFAMQEAKRLGLQLGFHFSDGFAIGGGPWITPELSMQKLVWTETLIKGGDTLQVNLPQPETYKNYYKNIAVLAYPSIDHSQETSYGVIPVITTSKGIKADYLSQRGNKESFKSEDTCWIQYAFKDPFTCRSVKVKTSGNNYQSQRLLIMVSDDGVNFRSLGRLNPPRHGWQDTDADITNEIIPVTAKYFRFVYDKTGSEPGAEDLDAAKWKPVLKITGIELSGKPQINQFEGKNGEVWRISKNTTIQQIPDSLCVPLKSIIDLTDLTDMGGQLKWNAPVGEWTILRIGYTSTGHTNATGGAAIGLECDKFNPQAVKLQFNNWFGEAVKQVGPVLASEVLKIFHVDSWECGSQNWSPVFRTEFKKRRGYDLLNYLPAMAGIPVQTASVSERFLFDVRQTITDLLNDNFYAVLKGLAHSKGCAFTAESVAPTMIGDGMLHYNQVDIPMGEFWLNSPTHDKPNDMLDAISGAHIYGKNIIQAEAFTTLKMTWNEYPGMMKILQDRNYALGINRLVYHVFAHNPWTDRKPGMTLDGVGLYFQRDQTWWKQAKAWVDYSKHCQNLLQKGNPVVDIAVFTGEEIPRRSVLPDRLVTSLPGILGKEKVNEEVIRLANKNEPVIEEPAGVWHSANMTKTEDWIDALHGYQYDSFNPDALIRLASVKNGRIVLPGGASYGLLVIPGKHLMNPNAKNMSVAVASKLLQLVKEGAVILMSEKPEQILGLKENNDSLKLIVDQLWPDNALPMKKYQLGKGHVIIGSYTDSSFAGLGIEKDVMANNSLGKPAGKIAWTHRKEGKTDIYFISNQQNETRSIDVSLRAAGREPEIYNPVTNETRFALNWQIKNGRTLLPMHLEAGESVFIILRKQTSETYIHKGYKSIETEAIHNIENAWSVSFDKQLGGPTSPVVFDSLTDWTCNPDSAIRYYSGTAAYKNSFIWDQAITNQRVWLSLGKVANIASVNLNGIDCGIAWTFPYRVEITKAVLKGKNQLTINVTNTWANRLIGDQNLPPDKRITNTTAPVSKLQGKPLYEAGLFGPVKINISSTQLLKK